MTFTEQMEKLATRAKLAEDRAAAAGDKARADLERDVADARASAQADAQKLRESVEAGEGRASERWSALQQSWNEHIAGVRRTIDDQKAKHDLTQARRDADEAEYDALYAIDYAYSAIEEAESSVLDAELARMTADDLESGARSPA